MLKNLCREIFSCFRQKISCFFSITAAVVLSIFDLVIQFFSAGTAFIVGAKLYQKKSFICAAAALLLLSSCSTRYRNALFTSKEDPAREDIKAVYVVNNNEDTDVLYRIKPNDLLAVRNLQDIRYISAPDEGSGNLTAGISGITYRVEADGTVALPVIGKVEVNGLSRREAADKIQAVYEKNLLKDPIIDVTIVNLKVTMLGEFIRQGNFLLEKDNTSLVEMIGEAGGITQRADPKKLKIIRGDLNAPETIYVNLKDINSLSSKKLILQNNDIIYLEPQGVYGNTERTQIFSSFVQPVLLLLNTALLIYNFSTR